MMKELRKAIGKKKLLTLASVASGKYIDFAAIEPYIDFVNIMTYDVANPPYHHAPLFRSDLTRGTSCDEAVKLTSKQASLSIVWCSVFLSMATAKKELPVLSIIRTLSS